MDYEVLTAVTTSALEALVRTAIADGWTPIGGVSYITDGGDGVLAQAMTKAAALKRIEDRKKSQLAEK